MSIELGWGRIASLGLRPLLSGGTQEGVLGGIDLAVPRIGDRFIADLSTAQLRQDAESRLLVAALMEGTTADVRIALRMPNRSRSIGGGTVDGSGVGGSTLPLANLYPGTVIERGDFFSIVHGGRHYVHMAAAAGMASADGKMQLPIWPMLRFLTVDGERVALDAPMIEGQLVGFDARGVRFVRNRAEPFEFSIRERA